MKNKKATDIVAAIFVTLFAIIAFLVALWIIAFLLNGLIAIYSTIF